MYSVLLSISRNHFQKYCKKIGSPKKKNKIENRINTKILILDEIVSRFLLDCNLEYIIDEVNKLENENEYENEKDIIQDFLEFDEDINFPED